MASGRPRSGRAHEAIIDATLETVRELGYHRTTIEGIATRAGVGKATIYRWWRTKSDVVMEAISQRLRYPPPLTGDSYADIRAMLQNLIEIMDGPVGHVLPGLASDLGETSEAAARLRDVLGPYRAANAAVLLSAAAHGDLPSDIDTTIVLDALIGGLLYRRQMLRPRDPDLADKLTRLVLTHLVLT